MKAYFNIHNHTHYSNLKLPDATTTVQTLLKTSIEQNLSGFALTDHGVCSGWVDLEHEFDKVKATHPDFKVAFGSEIYMAHTRERGQKMFHFVLAAKNFEGVKLIREISSKGWIDSYWDATTRLPVLHDELKAIVQKSPGNIIASSACLGGELARLVAELIHNDSMDVRKAIAEHVLFMKELFGGDYYIEVAPSDDEEQIAFNQRVVSIANVFQVKMIFATDTHYARPENRATHSLYLNSKGGERETDKFYRHTYVMSYEEAKKLLLLSYDADFIEQMRLNTLEIQEKIDLFSLGRTSIIRQAPVIEPEYCGLDVSEYETLHSWLNGPSAQNRFFAKTCINYVVKHFDSDEYLARIEEEADILQHISNELGMEMSAYMNHMSYYMSLFWQLGSMIGPGRGSAAAFLSALCLGITQVDPIEYELPVFRFLNKEAVGLPKMLGK